MNVKEHLLTCLAEECSEVAKEVSKALRFGLNDKYPKDPDQRTNSQRIVDELNDLVAVVKMLEAEKILPDRCAFNYSKQYLKVGRVTKYMKYARKVKALK